MAHTKSQGSSSNGRDSAGQRLGVKRFGGELIPAGTIILRQRGTRVYPGRHVGMSSDHTLFAKIPGVVKFEWRRGGQRQVSIIPPQNGN